MLAWKGAVTLRQRLERAARQSGNPEEKKLWADLQAAATQLAAASRATPKPTGSMTPGKKLNGTDQAKGKVGGRLKPTQR